VVVGFYQPSAAPRMRWRSREAPTSV